MNLLGWSFLGGLVVLGWLVVIGAIFATGYLLWGVLLPAVTR